MEILASNSQNQQKRYSMLKMRVKQETWIIKMPPSKNKLFLERILAGDEADKL